MPDEAEFQTSRPLKRDGRPVQVPTHCPFCGVATSIARHIFSAFFEVTCEDGCGKTCIVADDHQVF